MSAQEMNNERAYNAAYNVIANVSNSYMQSFPGFDRLGLNPDVPADSMIADAIIYALQAGESYADRGMDSEKAGRLVAMIRYGIVSMDDIIDVVGKYRSYRSTGEI